MTRAAAVVVVALTGLTACHRGTPLAATPQAPRALAAAIAPARTGPDVSAYFRLPDTVPPYQYRWMRMDPPLTLTVDADGNPHQGLRQYRVGPGLILTDDEISIDMAYITQYIAAAGTCVADPQGNISCPSPALVPLPKPTILQATNEIAQLVRIEDGAWQLQHVPFDVVDCVRNGQAQQQGADFLSSGTLLTSGVWAAQDIISCTYTYAKY